jgi:DNA mismatch repair protein MutS2
MIFKRKRGTDSVSSPNELHLRHLMVNQALLKLGKYLNDAFMSDLWQIRVIHGKGTGTICQEVHRKLAKHPLVKSYRLGGYGVGSTGVTIVKLV